MKKILLIVISLIFVLFFNISITNAENSSNDEKLELIEKYIKKQKKDIKKIVEKYEIVNNKDLFLNIKSLNELLNIIKRAKDAKLDDEKKEQVTKYISKTLKELNTKSKDILKKEKLIFENKLAEYQKNYINLWNKIKNKIDSLITFLYNSKIKNKNNLNLRESILKSNLEKLKEKSDYFKSFWEIKFNSKEEIKSWFKKIIEEIKIELLKLKRNLVY